MFNCVETVKTKVLIKRPFEEAGLDESVDVLGDEGRLEGLGVSLDGLSVAVDQKLLEVPGDVAAFHRIPDDELWIGHQAEINRIFDQLRDSDQETNKIARLKISKILSKWSKISFKFSFYT